ncbi:asparaginase-domain-containing protein [Butyriboletus roseoflavus]|nr:asparaginase-domain-containing protein [Butyriboletus roseoflavus]
MELSHSSDEARVLVIYTGGTIGMLVGAQGYVPEPFFLTETLRSQKRFHDPLQDSLFSHASSVKGYREWSTSGKSSPSVTETPLPPTSGVPHPTLWVKSSRPIGRVPTLAPDASNVPIDIIQCERISDDTYQARLPCLVTPRSVAPGFSSGKRIRYAILEWDPLLDSSNIEINDWIRIATEIELNYMDFDAFVVLHGTDTMSYSSSALSFLLEDLGKTVILTGAQISLSQLRNDAVDNLLGALTIAGHYIIPECSLYFNHTLYRGNRVSKISSYDLNAFHSPDFPPLVNVGIDIVVNWNEVLRQTNLRRFRAHKEMSPYVANLRLFPGMSDATIHAFLAPPTRGIVLETFGAGNAPQRSDLMAALKQACDSGIVIVAITQCLKGSVSGAYETGRTLQKVGVVAGGDMTPECALTKLAYLLSKPELSVNQIRELISMPLRGELTRPTLSPPNRPPTVAPDLPNIQELLTQFVRLSSSSSVHQIPKITFSASVGDDAQDVAASWSDTASETASTEAALLPLLIHLAAARNDIQSLKFCISTAATWEAEDITPASIPGGIVNCLEAGSGRSPLHVAALIGNTASVIWLLKSGALVHLRDALGHTALYYAARQGHEDIVDTLVGAGANLGGLDYEAGYAELSLKNALNSGDQNAIEIWGKTGMGTG